MSQLICKNLLVGYEGKAILDPLNFEIHAGGYLCVVGENGAGKSTLMKMLCTLLRPTSGQITYNGKNIQFMQDKYRDVLGYLPQDFGFYPDLTVKEYLLYIASIKGIQQKEAKRRVKILIAKVGLEKVANRKMKKLSGGMQRRAGIAQAMLNNPRVLILDEPTAGLDPNERVRFRNLISELAEDRLVLLSTHIVSDVEYIANEILLMKDGRILQHGTSEQIIQSMNEHVWKCYVEKKEVPYMMKQYKISNLKNEGSKVELRIISKQMPHQSATLEQANLEDVFLNYFGEMAGDYNA